MKHLLTAIACCLVVACFGQGTAIHEYPWNPDWNNDNFVGSSDLTGFLSAFGSEFGNPPEPCDYDGTPLEEFLFGVLNGTIVLDSMFIEFELEQISSYYIGGCPDPIIDTVSFADYCMMRNFEIAQNVGEWWIWGYDPYGHEVQFLHSFDGANGQSRVRLICQAIYDLGFSQDGFFDPYYAWTDYVSLPFPSSWEMNENGIFLHNAWGSDDWPYYANYMHILPYWHYAE